MWRIQTKLVVANSTCMAINTWSMPKLLNWWGHKFFTAARYEYRPASKNHMSITIEAWQNSMDLKLKWFEIWLRRWACTQNSISLMKLARIARWIIIVVSIRHYFKGKWVGWDDDIVIEQRTTGSGEWIHCLLYCWQSISQIAAGHAYMTTNISIDSRMYTINLNNI